MVIVRAGVIAREVEAFGRRKVAAAPDSGRANEPWQWRLTVGEQSSTDVSSSRQDLIFDDPVTGRREVLELACETNLVRGSINSEEFESRHELRRREGELVVVYVHSGQLAFDRHTLSTGDAAIVSGDEHYEVMTQPVSGRTDAALIRLEPVSETGLVWIP